MQRRSDHKLREAINHLEGLVVQASPPDVVLKRCAEELLYLLQGARCWVFDVLDQEGTQWQLLADYQLCEEKVEPLQECVIRQEVPDALRPYLRSGRCWSTTEPLPSGLLMPDGYDNFSFIPIRDANKIHAAIGIFDTRSEVVSDLSARLRPLIAAVTCLLRTSPVRLDKSEHSASITEMLTIFDTLTNGVLVLDSDEKVSACNQSVCRMVGLPRNQLLGQPVDRFLRGGCNISRAMVSGTTWRSVPVYAVNGDKHMVDITVSAIQTYGKPKVCVVLDDVSERLEFSESHQAAVQRFQALTSILPIGMLQLDNTWACHYANDTWCDFVRLTAEEVYDHGWLHSIYSGDCDDFLADLRQQTMSTGRFSGEVRVQTPLGNVLWAKINACSLYSSNGDIAGFILTCHDITDHLVTEKRLKEAAETDALTGLSNRSAFSQKLELSLSEAHRYGGVALIFIDLDNFKLINDTLGHDAGDALLVEVANRLRDVLRKVDYIFRVGGDEFTVIVSHIKQVASVKMIAEKIVTAMATPFLLNGRSVYVTCSLGLSVYEDKMTKDTLVKQADVALYKAKEAGRNQYQFFTSALNRDASMLISLRESVRERIDDDFRVVFQPQVNAVTGELVGLESLARWRMEGEDVGPHVFIKLLEQCGLINEFSDWLFDRVFDLASRWKGQLVDGVKIALNLSARQFRNTDLVYSITEKCQKAGVDPRDFVLEVTETALISDTELASGALSKLRKIGFSISLDDFGTGYSSLMYLRSMPITSVKIDRSFTKDVLEDPEDAQIVAGILNLASALGLSVVAEGVETEDVAQWLVDHDCPIHQGFLYDRPLEAARVHDLLLRTE